MSAGEFLSEPVDIVEVPVGLVLVLLVELIFVESLIVEARGIWSGRLWADLGVGCRTLDSMLFGNGGWGYVPDD